MTVGNLKEVVDKRKRKWELFIDDCYFHMPCVRCISLSKKFDSHTSFHFPTMEKAKQFISLIEESS